MRFTARPSGFSSAPLQNGFPIDVVCAGMWSNLQNGIAHLFEG
jgi:hypothetical protein